MGHTYKPKPKYTSQFDKKLSELDPYAKRHPQDLLLICHARCGKWIKIRAPSNIGWFKDHVGKCKGQASGGIRTLDSMKDTWFSKAKTTPSTRLPCPGLSSESDSRIEAYLSRSSASGGGGPAYAVIVNEYFGSDKDYLNLTPSERLEVLAIQQQRRQWTNVHHTKRIYSTSCPKIGRTETGGSKVLPCVQCSEVLQLPGFNRVLRTKAPDEDNMKYVPKRWREIGSDELLGKYEGRSLKTIISAYKTVSLISLQLAIQSSHSPIM